jgi:hypothetical protein
MEKQLEALRNDGWKDIPLFNGYKRAVERVSEMGDF